LKVAPPGVEPEAEHLRRLIAERDQGINGNPISTSRPMPQGRESTWANRLDGTRSLTTSPKYLSELIFAALEKSQIIINDRRESYEAEILHGRLR
jgi:hypothetical protein